MHPGTHMYTATLVETKEEIQDLMSCLALTLSYAFSACSLTTCTVGLLTTLTSKKDFSITCTGAATAEVHLSPQLAVVTPYTHIRNDDASSAK